VLSHLNLRNLTKKLRATIWNRDQERQRSEQKISEQAALLDIATDAILVRDLENKILFWNKEERLYGWKVEEGLAKNANELLYRQETLSQLQNNQKSLAECGSWQGWCIKSQEGKGIIVASRWTLVRDEDGNLNPPLPSIQTLQRKTARSAASPDPATGEPWHTCWRHCPRPQQYIDANLAVAQLLQLKFPMPMGRVSRCLRCWKSTLNAELL